MGRPFSFEMFRISNADPEPAGMRALRKHGLQPGLYSVLGDEDASGRHSSVIWGSMSSRLGEVALTN